MIRNYLETFVRQPVQVPARRTQLMFGAVGYGGAGSLLADGIIDENDIVLQDEDGSPLEDG